MEVRFGFVFDAVPAVVVQLAAVDAASPNSKRIDVWSSDETLHGFRVHVRSWEDAATYSVKVSWVATTDHALVQLGMLSFGGTLGGAKSCSVDPEVHVIAFPAPFACTPDVVCSLSAIDAQGATPLHLSSESGGAHPRGCELHCGGWGSGELRAGRVSWVASASPAVLQSGSVELGTREEPIRGGVARIAEVRFERAFDDVPGVALALAGVHLDCAAHTRIDTWSDCVDRDGFRIHVRSWEDSVTWSVKVTWVATPVVSRATASLIPPHQPPAEFIVDGPPLGKGWCAVTHRAKHAISGRVYAVKTSRYPFKQHEQTLRQELQNLIRLPLHQNLLRYHECILQADRLHIVTEYLDAFRFVDLVPGPDGDYVEMHNTATVLLWLMQLLDGLAHLHAVGLVHRDLHGENVLVEKGANGAPSHGPHAVRIIDFGAAGFYGDPPEPRLMSHQAGCFRYFSPERRGGGAFDGRDDVWAAGCHLTELATGRSLSRRPDCGAEGRDFAWAPEEVRRAIQDCEAGGVRCRDLAEVLLELNRDERPDSARAFETARRLLGQQLLKKRARPAGGCSPGSWGTPRGPGGFRRQRCLLSAGETPPGSRRRPTALP